MQFYVFAIVTMNVGKRNYNGWILCPSKTFPGKFYYFNVLNGEAAWSLTELESKSRNNFIHEITDKCHNYPEPDSPPIDDTSSPSWLHPQPEYSFTRQNTARFGQAVFPKYTPRIEPCTSNIWAPFKVQTPMVMGNSMIDQTKRTWVTDRQYIQSFGPTSKRYIRYDPRSIPSEPLDFNNDYNTPTTSMGNTWMNHQNVNRQVFGQKQTMLNNNHNIFGNQNPFRNNPFNKRPENQVPIINRPIMRRLQTKSESHANIAHSNMFSETKDNLNLTDHISSFKMLNLSPKKSFMRPQDKTSKKFTSTKSIENHTLDNCVLFRNSSVSPVNRAQYPTKAVKQDFLFQKSVHVHCNDTTPNKRLGNNTHTPCYGITTLSPTKRVQFQKISRTMTENIFTGKINEKNVQTSPIGNSAVELKDSELDVSDLRYMLMLKRRKTDTGEVNTPGKRVKTSYTNEPRDTNQPKKRVTFVLGVEDDEIIEETPGEEIQEEPLTISTLRRLAEPGMSADVWYIAVDTELLLEEFDFIDNYVRTDEKCKLLVPDAVRAEIDALCVGDCRPRQSVVVARQLSRRLASPPPHIAVVSSYQDSTEISTNDAIIKCCLQLVNQDYHACIITNNMEFNNKAEEAGLCSYQLQEIKDGAAKSNPKVTFDLQRIHTPIKTNNDVIKGNIAYDFTPSSVAGREQFPVNCFRKKLFENVTADGEEVDLNEDIAEKYVSVKNFAMPYSEKNKTKSIFSPRQQNTYDLDNDISLVTTQISRHIENLNIKDTEHNQVTTDKENMLLPATKAREQRHSAAVKNKLSINGYTLEEHLKRFYVKSKMVLYRINTRIEEWICYYSQIMEDVLSSVLQANCAILSKDFPPPWTIQEAVVCVKKVYGDHTSVKIVAEKLSMIMLNCSCMKGKLKPTILPNDFMKILGCGFILIMSLKSVLPECKDLADAEVRLGCVLHQIESPTEPEPFQPPAHSCSDVLDAPEKTRCNFVKKPSVVIDYLRKHFREWQSYPDTTGQRSTPGTRDQTEKVKSIKICRTFGRNLNMLKLDNNKTMTLNKQCDRQPDLSADKSQHQSKGESTDRTNAKNTCDVIHKEMQRPEVYPKMKEIDIEKREAINKDLISMIGQIVIGEVHSFKDTIKKDEHKRKVKAKENATILSRGFDSDAPYKIPKITKNNTEATKVFYTPDDTEPKVTRHLKHVQTIDCLYKTVKNRKRNDEKIDMDLLDYSEQISDDDISQRTNDISNCDVNTTNDNKAANHARVPVDQHAKSNDCNPGDSDTYTERDDFNDNGKAAENNWHYTDFCDETGFVSDSLASYMLARKFLEELSVTFKMIHAFITSSITEFREGEVRVERKRVLQEKANKTILYIASIEDKLQSIIERESSAGPTLKSLLDKCDAPITDKRMTRYRHVVTKCIEQADVLRHSLRALIALTSQGIEPCTSPDSASDDGPYLNIYK